MLEFVVVEEREEDEVEGRGRYVAGADDVVIVEVGGPVSEKEGESSSSPKEKVGTFTAPATAGEEEVGEEARARPAIFCRSFSSGESEAAAVRGEEESYTLETEGGSGEYWAGGTGRARVVGGVGNGIEAALPGGKGLPAPIPVPVPPTPVIAPFIGILAPPPGGVGSGLLPPPPPPHAVVVEMDLRSGIAVLDALMIPDPAGVGTGAWCEGLVADRVRELPPPFEVEVDVGGKGA